MDEHPKPRSKSTRINGAPTFWSWDIGTPWLHMGNDSESKRVNIFTCYIDFKNWINHLKTTNYRGIYSSKIAFLPYWIQTKNPRQSVFTLKFGQTKRWQLRRLLLFNDEKYYHSNIFPHIVSFQKQGGEQWELIVYGFTQRPSIAYPMVCVKMKFSKFNNWYIKWIW